MKRTLTIVIAGLVVVFALGACGAASNAVSKGAKTALQDATGCKVNGNDKNAQVQCKNGKSSFSVGSGAGLPDGFPKSQVPVPNGKILSSVSTTNNGKPGYNVTVQVSGSLKSAAADYQSSLESKGFTVDSGSSFNLGGSSGLTSYRATSPSWDVTVIGSGGGGSSGNENGLNVTVAAHDPSTDTTTPG